MDPAPHEKQVIRRIGKLLESSAGLSAALATLNFSVNLGAHISARPPPRLVTPAFISTASLTSLGQLLSDCRKTLRLTALIPLYLRLKSVRSSKTVNAADRWFLLAQYGAFAIFQGLENICHLHAKGVLPPSLVNKRGGLTQWIRWSCRIWCLGLTIGLMRLWHNTWNPKSTDKPKTVEEKIVLDRKWWDELKVVMCWLPVAINSSFYPEGVKFMNPRTVATFSLLASWTNLAARWRATAVGQ
ncbi:hypothetical protein FE257_003583 [Aspergillus nanangensis]|uniref:Uncharacterized protein n=1 Tax=Aspergillus nanangensis TaxID=2582783 RepID=A0AAD4CTQ7_ASPNN|nr:hypothetical protein FE257_003583 [Aspergillus nanangensis]